MSVNKARENYYFHTGQASTISRQLNLAGLAVVWLFVITDGNGGYALPTDFLIALLLFVGALTADLLQYIAGSLIWGIYHHRIEQNASCRETEILAPAKINWPTLGFFWLKLIATLVAYVGLFIAILY